MRSWLTLFAILCLPATTLAVGQDEASVSGGLGLALAYQETTHVGVQAEARLLRGISDSWGARLGVQSAWYPANRHLPSSHITAQSMGLTWAADVLRWVPLVDFGIAVADIRGGGMTTTWRLGGQLGLGLDYLVSRHLTLSLMARAEYFPLRMAGGHDAHPAQAGLALHVGRVF